MGFKLPATLAPTVVTPGATLVTWKVAELLPAGTVTEAGTVATAVLLEVRVTVMGAAAAAPRVTVTVRVLPGGPDNAKGPLGRSTVMGFTVRVPETGLTEGIAGIDAVMLTEGAGFAVATPVTGNVADVVPAGIVTVAGTEAQLGLEDVSCTTVLVVCGLVRLTVA